METTRQNKISRLLQKELSEIFLLQTKAMTGVLVSVSAVRISPDMSIALYRLRTLLAGLPSKHEPARTFTIHLAAMTQSNLYLPYLMEIEKITVDLKSVHLHKLLCT